jgi:hypothetical protein
MLDTWLLEVNVLRHNTPFDVGQFHSDKFLGASAKLQKALISFVMSACPSAGTTRTPLEGFL